MTGGVSTTPHQQVAGFTCEASVCEIQRQTETEIGRETETQRHGRLPHTGQLSPYVLLSLIVKTSVTDASPGSWVSVTTPEVCHQALAFHRRLESRTHRAARPHG